MQGRVAKNRTEFSKLEISYVHNHAVLTMAQFKELKLLNV